MRRVAAVAVALALGAVLAACAAEPSAGAGEAASATALPSAPPTGDTGGSGSGGTESGGTEAVGCLHGTWTADNAFFLSAIREFGDEVKGVTGEVVLTFAPDGVLTTEYRDWVITAVTDGAAVTLTRDGTDLGRFEAGDTTVALEDTKVGSILVMNAAGAEIPIAPAPAVYTEAPYTCDVSAAAITTPDGTLELVR